MKKPCTTDGCNKPARSKNMCKNCYERDYRNKNPEKVAERNRKYAMKNRKKVLRDKRNYYKNNKDKHVTLRKEWYAQNADKKKAYEKQYRADNIDRCRKYAREYVSSRVNKDSLYKLKRDIRRLINVSIKNGKYTKRSRTYDLIGVSYSELREYLLQTFMDRYGRLPCDTDIVHIDHIVPCSQATSQEEMEKLQHYTNLQWLLAKDNFKKSDRLDWDE